jgi:hypothetical protein
MKKIKSERESMIPIKHQESFYVSSADGIHFVIRDTASKLVWGEFTYAAAAAAAETPKLREKIRGMIVYTSGDTRIVMLDTFDDYLEGNSVYSVRGGGFEACASDQGYKNLLAGKLLPKLGFEPNKDYVGNVILLKEGGKGLEELDEERIKQNYFFL